MNAISVSELSKQYGDRSAVNKISFDVPAGSVCGFIGPNGSGKTTTIRMLLGLISPSQGSGEVLGESILHPARYLDRVGAMIEGPAFYPSLSGIENLKVLAHLGGFSTERIPKLLEIVDLEDRGASKFKTYSLGMKQRLGIAAALLPDPSLLILDEPTNGLDPAGIQEVRQLLRNLADQGMTVFVSSHLLSELEMISNHLVMLREGQVLFTGPIDQLLLAQKPVLVAKTAAISDLNRLQEIVRATGRSAEILNDELRVVAESEWAAELNRHAFAAGILLVHLVASRPSLEQTFFEMTETK